jgi:membrane dipeptidase
LKELVWDKTLAWNAWFRDDVTLPRLKRAGYSVVGLTIGGDNGGRAAAMLGLESVARMVEQHPSQYRVVREIADVDLAVSAGQLALELNFQGTASLEGRLEAVEEFHRLGVRQMGLVWNSDNEAGCSAAGTHDTGLTAFGRSLVREMNRAGVIVDGTHASYRTTMDAMEVCDVPFVFSHGNVDAIEPSYKNLKDEQIRRCAESGGVVGISGFGTYLDDLQVPPTAMFRQIDYVCELVGAQHVGLGLDFLRDAHPLWEKVRTHPQLWPGVRESRFFPPEEIKHVRDLMQKAGYAQKDVAGILGENWKRVSGSVWSTRASADGTC